MTSSIIRGTHGDDNLTGTDGNDRFVLVQGGNDTVSGGAGNDVFSFGAAFTAADHIDGGADKDTVILKGDYSAGVTFAADTMVNVETLSLIGNYDYNLTTNDATVAAGATLTVKANGIGGGHGLVFDGSAESDGHFRIAGSAGDDVITGGAQNDVFRLENGGVDTVNGGGGNDNFYLGDSLWSDSQIDGGSGHDTIHVTGFAGGDGITFTSTTVQHIEDFVIDNTSGLGITTDDATVAAGATMTFDASATSGGFFFDGSAETDGRFVIVGGSGADDLTGGARNDVFHLENGGNDTAHGGGGNDTFDMGAALTAADQIDGGTGSDTVVLDGTYFGGTALTFGANTITNVETIALADGHNYRLTENDGNVAAGQTLTVDASALAAGRGASFDGSAESDGAFHFIAGSGTNAFTGGAQADAFDLTHGTADSAFGGGGSDTFAFACNFVTGDVIDGGAGSDTLAISGSYASLVFSDANQDGIETLALGSGFAYHAKISGDITYDSAINAGSTLTVDASGASSLSLDLSGAVSPGYAITASAGDDTVTFASNLLATDTIDGGHGNDTLALVGDYSAGFTFGPDTITSIETLKLGAGGTYDLTTDDANVAAAATLTVDATALTAANAMIFDGGAETDGAFLFRFGAGFVATDSLTGGAGDDTLELNGTYIGGTALTLGVNTLDSVETLVLDAGTPGVQHHVYDITSNDANVAAGLTLTVDASALLATTPGGGDSVHFDGSAELDGSFHFIAGGGVNSFIGGAQADTFDMLQGTVGTVDGGGGDDIINLGANANPLHQRIEGGAGFDTVTVGASVASLGFDGSQDSDLEKVVLKGGYAYSMSVTGDITSGSENPSGTTLAIDASGASSLSLDLTQATSPAYAVTGSGGSDTIHFGVLTINDTIDGGAGGDDTLYISGDVGSDSLQLNPDTLVNIDHLVAGANAEIELVLDDATIAAGATMTFDGRAVTTHGFYIDGEFETDGHLDITGGGDFGSLAGGALSDTIVTIAHTSWYAVMGLGGADTINLSSGEDDVLYEAVTDSTGTAHDVVSGFDASEDHFAFYGNTVGGFDGVLTGTVNAATLDSDLHAITSGALVANDAWEVDVTSGDLSGHQFLIVDVNGNALYDGGSDYLIDISGHTGTISMANFI